MRLFWFMASSQRLDFGGGGWQPWTLFLHQIGYRFFQPTRQP